MGIPLLKSMAGARKVTVILIAAGTLGISGCGSSNSKPEANPSTASGTAATTVVPETQDSGMYGIVIPGTATNRAVETTDHNGGTATFINYSATGMTFDEASQWMASRLPVNAALDGMVPCGVEQLDGIHSWFWGGGENEPFLAVRVMDGNPPRISIHHIERELVGC